MAKKKVVKGTITEDNKILSCEIAGKVAYHSKAKQYMGEVFGGKAIGWHQGGMGRGKELASINVGWIKTGHPANGKEVQRALLANADCITLNMLETILGSDKCTDIHLKACVHLGMKVKPEYQAKYDRYKKKLEKENDPKKKPVRKS